MFQRAIFFALLNPQPNGAGFVGVYTNTTNMNQFSTKTGFKIKVLLFLKINFSLTFYSKIFKGHIKNKDYWLGHQLLFGWIPLQVFVLGALFFKVIKPEIVYNF